MTDRAWTDADRTAMARALALAEQGRGSTRPNPMVGCVLVDDGEIVGEGWHREPGGPHAEIAALQAAGDRARGATAYVSLEPCDHTGRTGPCSQALIEAGVAEVVYAIDDPDPDASGGGRVLADAGVRVQSGLLEDWAATQNEVFLVSRRAGRPFLTLKLAQTLDGQLRTPRGASWITGREARTAVHRLRAEVDAVLVGSQTVLDDDPLLDVRHVEARHGQPRAVVLDGRGRTPADAAVVKSRGRGDGDRPTLVLTTSASDRAWRHALEEAGVEVVVVEPGDEGGVDIDGTLRALLERDLQHVMVEGGARVAAALVNRGVVDRLVLHIALTVVGPRGLPGVAPAAAVHTGDWVWATEKVGHVGRDLEVVATPTVPAHLRTGGS